MKERYIIVDGSRTMHCCFEATVIDTKTDRNVCECTEAEQAKFIVHALNERNSK